MRSVGGERSAGCPRPLSTGGASVDYRVAGRALGGRTGLRVGASGAVNSVAETAQTTSAILESGAIMLGAALVFVTLFRRLKLGPSRSGHAW